MSGLTRNQLIFRLPKLSLIERFIKMCMIGRDYATVLLAASSTLSFISGRGV